MNSINFLLNLEFVLRIDFQFLIEILGISSITMK